MVVISFLPELFEKEQAEGGGVGHVWALEPEAAADADVEADVALRGWALAPVDVVAVGAAAA